jgi:AraC-like DNA-binding protein
VIEVLDALFRFGAVGILVLGAVVVLRGAGASAAGAFIAAFTFCVAAYLVQSSPMVESLPAAADVLLRFLAVAATAMFLLAVMAMFTDGFRLNAWHALPLVILEASAFAARGASEPIATAAAYVHQAAKLIVFVGAIVYVVRGYGADLIESRRRFRQWFVAAAALTGISIGVAETLLRGSAAPPALELLKVTAIAALALVLLAWCLEVRPMWFAGPAPAPAVTHTSPAEQQVLDALRHAMDDDRIYRSEGLTIGALAARMKAPEHVLRKVINQRLEYRNFNAFLNHYRIREVKQALVDPAKARLPVLTLALEAGYGSIGPFNRAFKDATGMTPTQFRQARGLADPENPAPIPESAMERKT